MQLECKECHRLLNLPDDKLPLGRPFSFNCPYCKQKNTSIIPVEAPAPSEPEDLPSDKKAPEAAADQGENPQPHSDQGDESAPPQEAGSYQGPPARRSTDQVPPEAGSYQGPPARRSTDRMPQHPKPNFGEEDTAALLSMIMGGGDDLPKALIVYDDETISEMLKNKIESIGYSAMVAVNMRDAAKQLKFSTFSILLIQEDYYGTTLRGNQLLKTIQALDSQSRRNMQVVLISPNVITLDDLSAFSLSFDAVINTSEIESIDRFVLSIMARGKKFYAIYREMLAEHGLD